MTAVTSMDPEAVRYRLAPSIRITFTNDGATVLDTADGRIIALNATGAELLRALPDASSEEQLCDVLARLPEAPAPDVVHAEVHAFLKGVIAARIIVEGTP